MKNVVIVQHRLLHYRVELFELMRKYLSDEKIVLHLIHGGPSIKEALRKDVGSLNWSSKITNKFITIKGVDIIWQQLPGIVNTCDLLVLMQENRIISNYPQILKRKFFNKKIAYWGHGQNLQSSNPSGIKETWKKKWLKSVDWWFAYTSSTVKYLSNQGFSQDKITCLNNAIDVNTFKVQLESITDNTLQQLREELNVTDSTPIGVFCGSLYPEKRLDLMLDAIDLIREKIPDFTVIVIGDGPSASAVKESTKNKPWVQLVGVKKGIEKAKYYRLASIILNPGLVGLHILDSFCAGVPMATTDDALHSPEYDYLENGRNGLVTKGTAIDYAKSIIELLDNESVLNEMKRKAFLDSQKYTVETMAKTFSDGIISALGKKES